MPITILSRKRSIRGALLSALLLAVPAFSYAKPAGSLSVAACARDITPVSEGLSMAYEDKFGESPTVNHSDPIYMAGFGTGREATD